MKLMIIAQPKSASTSLLRGVGQVTGLTAEQVFYSTRVKWSLPVRVLNRALRVVFKSSKLKLQTKKTTLSQEFPSFDYWALSLLHSDIADFEPLDTIDSFMECDIHKQHLPPLEGNLKHFQNVPKVLLIRGVEETIQSYKRVKGLNTLAKNLLNSTSFVDRLKTELIEWQEGWLKIAENDKSFLIIEKDDLVREPGTVVSKIVSFAGFPNVSLPVDYKLPRERYYR